MFRIGHLLDLEPISPRNVFGSVESRVRGAEQLVQVMRYIAILRSGCIMMISLEYYTHA